MKLPQFWILLLYMKVTHGAVINHFDSSSTSATDWLTLTPHTYDLDQFTLSFWLFTNDGVGSTARRGSSLYRLDQVFQFKIAAASDKLEMTQLLGNTISSTSTGGFSNQVWGFVLTSYASGTLNIRINDIKDTFTHTVTKKLVHLPKSKLGENGKNLRFFEVVLYSQEYESQYQSVVGSMMSLFQRLPASMQLIQYLVFYHRQNINLIRDFSPYGMDSQLQAMGTSMGTTNIQTLVPVYDELLVIKQTLTYLALTRSQRTVSGYNNYIPPMKSITINFWIQRVDPATPTNGHDFTIFRIDGSSIPETIKIKHQFTTPNHIVRYETPGNSQDVTTTTMNQNTWHHVGFAHKFINERLIYSMVDTSVAYNNAPTTEFGGAFGFKALKFGDSVGGAVCNYYAYKLSVWSIYRPPQEVLEVRLREYDGYRHPNLVSLWKLEREDYPDGLIIHDFATQLSAVTTSTDYGGTPFDGGNVCGYLTTTCTDPVANHLVFKDGNHYDVTIDFGATGPTNFQFEQWIYYDINVATPPAQTSPLVIFKQRSFFELAVFKDGAQTYERLVVNREGAGGIQAEKPEKRGQWFHFKVMRIGNSFRIQYNSELLVNLNLIPVGAGFNILISSNATDTSLIYTFKEVKVWNTVSLEAKDPALQETYGYFKHHSIYLDEFDQGELYFYGKFIGEDTAMILTQTGGVGSSLAYTDGQLALVAVEAPPVALRVCQLGMRYLSDGYCGSEERELFISEPQNGNRQKSITFYTHSAAIKQDFVIQMWAQIKIIGASIPFLLWTQTMATTEVKFSIKYQNTNSTIYAKNNAAYVQLGLSEDIDTKWVSLLYDARAGTNTKLHITHPTTSSKSYVKQQLDLGSALTLTNGLKFCPTTCSGSTEWATALRSFKIVHSQSVLEDYLDIAYFQSNPDKYFWDVDLDFHKSNRFYGIMNDYLPQVHLDHTVANYNMLRSSYQIGRFDCGQWGHYNMMTRQCESMQYYDYFNKDHVYHVATAGITLQQEVWHVFWMNSMDNILVDKYIFKHDGSAATTLDDFRFKYNAASDFKYTYNAGGAATTYLESPTTQRCVPGRWCFVYMMRQHGAAGNIEMGVMFTPIATGTAASQPNSYPIASQIYIGGNDQTSGNDWFKGYLDNFQILTGTIGFLGLQDKHSLAMEVNMDKSILHLSFYYNNFIEVTSMPNFANQAVVRSQTVTMYGSNAYFKYKDPATLVKRRIRMFERNPAALPGQSKGMIADSSFTFTPEVGSTDFLIELTITPTAVANSDIVFIWQGLFQIRTAGGPPTTELWNDPPTTLIAAITSNELKNNFLYYYTVTKDKLYLGSGFGGAAIAPVIPDIVAATPYTITIKAGYGFSNLRVWNTPRANFVYNFAAWKIKSFFEPNEFRENLMLYAAGVYEEDFGKNDKEIQYSPVWYNGRYLTVMEATFVNSASYTPRGMECTDTGVWNGLSCPKYDYAFVMGGQHIHKFTFTLPQANWNDNTWAFEGFFLFIPGSDINIAQLSDSGGTVLANIALIDSNNQLQLNGTHIGTHSVTPNDETSWHHILFVFNTVAPNVKVYKNSVFNKDTTMTATPCPKTMTFMHAPTGVFMMRNLIIWDNIDVLYTLSAEHFVFRGFSYGLSNIIRYFPLTEQNQFEIMDYATGSTYSIFDMIDRPAQTNFQPGTLVAEQQYNTAPYKYCPAYATYDPFIFSQICVIQEKLQPVTTIKSLPAAPAPTFHAIPANVVSTYQKSSTMSVSFWGKFKMTNFNGVAHNILQFTDTILAGSSDLMVIIKLKVSFNVVVEFQRRDTGATLATLSSLTTTATNTWGLYFAASKISGADTMFQMQFNSAAMVTGSSNGRWYWCLSCGVTYYKSSSGQVGNAIYRTLQVGTQFSPTTDRVKDSQMSLNIIYNIDWFGEWLRDGRSDQVSYIDLSSQTYYEIETGLTQNDDTITCPFGAQTSPATLKCGLQTSSTKLDVAGNQVVYDFSNKALANLKADQDREFGLFLHTNILTLPATDEPVFQFDNVMKYDIRSTGDMSVTLTLDDLTTQQFTVAGSFQGSFKLLFMFGTQQVKIYNGASLIHTETLTKFLHLSTLGKFSIHSATNTFTQAVYRCEVFHPPPSLNQLFLYLGNQYTYTSIENSRIINVQSETHLALIDGNEYDTPQTVVSNINNGLNSELQVCGAHQAKVSGEGCIPLGGLLMNQASKILDTTTGQIVKFDNRMSIGTWINTKYIDTAVTTYQPIFQVNPSVKSYVKYTSSTLFDLRSQVYDIGTSATSDHDLAGKPINTWFHLTFTVGNIVPDGSTVQAKYYFNSGLVGTTPWVGTAGQSYQGTNVQLQIGNSAQLIRVMFQHIYIFGRTLNHAEIITFMTEEPDSSSNIRTLLVYYKLIEMTSTTLYDYSFIARSTSIAAEAVADTIVWDRNPTALVGPTRTFMSDYGTTGKIITHKHHSIVLSDDDGTTEDNLRTISLSGEVTITYIMRLIPGVIPAPPYTMKFLSLDTNYKHSIQIQTGTITNILFQHDSQSIQVKYNNALPSEWIMVSSAVSNVKFQKLYIGRYTENTDQYSEQAYIPSNTLPITPSILIGKDAASTPSQYMAVHLNSLKIFSKYYPYAYSVKYIMQKHVNMVDFNTLVAYYKFDTITTSVLNEAVDPVTSHAITRNFISEHDTLKQNIICDGDTYAMVTSTQKGYCQNKRRYLGFDGVMFLNPMNSNGQDCTIIMWVLFTQTDALHTDRLVIEMTNTWKAVLDSTTDYYAEILPSNDEVVRSTTNDQHTSKWVALVIRVFAPAKLFSMSTSKATSVWVTQTRSEDVFNFPGPSYITWATTGNQSFGLRSEVGKQVFIRELLFYNHYMTFQYTEFIMNSGITNPPEDKLSLLHYYKVDESGGNFIADESFITGVAHNDMNHLDLSGKNYVWKYWEEITSETEPLYLYCMRGVGQNRKFTNYCIRDEMTETCNHCPDANLKLCNGPTLADCFTKPPLDVYDPVKKAFLQCHPKCPGACSVGLDETACLCPAGQLYNVTTGQCVIVTHQPEECLVGTFYDFATSICVPVPWISDTLSPRPQCRKQNLTAEIHDFNIVKEYALIKFSANLQDPITPLVKTMITLEITGPFQPYRLNPNHTLNFLNNSTINMTWHLYGPQLIGQETFKITINDPNRFYTFYQCLSPEKYVLIKHMKGVVVTSEEEDAKTIAQYIGIAGATGAFGLLGFTFMLRLCTELIWSFVNAIQIIRLMPMWIPYLPPHVIALLDAFEFVSLDFGFFRDAWEYITPNIDILAPFQDEFSDDYSIYELESTKLLKNCAGIFMSAGIQVGIFIFSLIMSKLTKCCKRVNRVFAQSYGGFFYNTPLRFLIEIYLDLLLFASINLYTLSYSNYMETTSSFMSLYATIILSALPVALAYFIWKYQELIIDEEVTFTDQFSVLFDEINQDVYYTIHYYPMFLIRRTLYVLLISGMSGLLSGQFALFTFKAAFTYAYFVYGTPYYKSPVNFIMALNEVFIITLGGIAGSMLEQNWNYKIISGWVFDAVLLFQLLVNIVFVIWYIFYQLLQRVRQRLKSKSATNPLNTSLTTSGSPLLFEGMKYSKYRKDNLQNDKVKSEDSKNDDGMKLERKLPKKFRLQKPAQASKPLFEGEIDKMTLGKISMFAGVKLGGRGVDGRRVSKIQPIVEDPQSYELYDDGAVTPDLVSTPMSKKTGLSAYMARQSSDNMVGQPSPFQNFDFDDNVPAQLKKRPTKDKNKPPTQKPKSTDNFYDEVLVAQKIKLPTPKPPTPEIPESPKPDPKYQEIQNKFNQIYQQKSSKKKKK